MRYGVSGGGWERDSVGGEQRESNQRSRGGGREGGDEGQGHQEEKKMILGEDEGYVA